jgi:hypothetical protein
MTDPAWISVAIGVITVILGAPTFIREIRSMRSATLSHTATTRRGSRLTIITIGVLVPISLGLTAFDFYDRRNPGAVNGAAIQKAFADFRDYTEVYRRSYLHETVRLDGLHCRECSFNDVTFEWRGTAPYILEHPNFVRDAQGGVNIRMLSDNPIAELTIGFLHNVGATIPGFQFRLHRGNL